MIRSLKFPLSFFLAFLFFSVQAQLNHEAAGILPPSPTASELGKYGLGPIGLASGSANVSIPIYTYAAGKLSLPISLSYSANGLKVDQLASNVGLNWSLNAGGVITRIIRDQADDDVSYIPPVYPTSHSATDPEFISYLYAAGNTDLFDSEQDLYTFNFLQYTGKFVFDRSGNLIVMPFQNIKIERFIDTTTPDNPSYFKITTPDGVVFTFNFTESSSSVTLNTLGNACGGRDYNNLGNTLTSWFLTKIEHPAGDVINLEYQSTSSTYPASISQMVYAKLSEDPCAQGLGCQVIPETLCENKMTVNSSCLSRIWSTNYGSVEFTPTLTRTDVNDFKLDKIQIRRSATSLIKEFGLNYTFSTSSGFNNAFTATDDALKHRMFLVSLEERDSNSVAIKKHTFAYNDINNLPPRLSYAQDFWGYFNGASGNTTDFIPHDPIYVSMFGNRGSDRNPHSTYAQKGLLSKVTYPTGGSSSISYEANSYWGTHTVLPPIKTVSVAANGKTNPPFMRTATSDPINNSVGQSVTFNFGINFSDSATNVLQIDMVHHFGILTVKDLTTGFDALPAQRIYFHNPSGGAVANSATYTIDFQAGHTYVVTVDAYGFTVYAHVLFSYYPSMQQQTTNLETGGVRVSRVVDYDPITTKNEETNYTYGNHASPTHSAGIKGPDPVYYQTSMLELSCPADNSGGVSNTNCYFHDCTYASLNANSLISLYPMGGNNIYYQYVLVSKGSGFQNGAEEHEFMIQYDVPGQLVSGYDILTTSYTNLAWGNGEQAALRNYKLKSDGTFVIINETLNNYVLDSANNNYKDVSNMIVRKRHDLVCSASITIPCNTANRQKIYQQLMCVAGPSTGHSHLYLNGGWAWAGIGPRVCIAQGANMQLYTFGQHPCYGVSDATVSVPSAIDNLDAIEYKNISSWYYLQSTTQKTYDDNGANPVSVVKKFIYDNPRHGFLTDTQTKIGSVVLDETKMWYPQDYGSIENLQTLRDKFIYDVPLKTEVYRDGLLTSGTVVKLTDVGLAKELYSFESSVPKTPVAHSSTVTVPANYYLKSTLNYNTANKLSELVSNKAPKTSYIWGYNNTYPIAEIKNASIGDAAYTSFEPSSPGSWVFSGKPAINASAPTGFYTYNLALGSLQRPSLNSATSYMLSYYATSGSAITVSGGSLTTLNTTSPKTGWVCTTVKITGATSITLSGTGTLDELRLFPLGALMTSYTYLTNVGVKTITDVNGVITTYTYDTAGRLSNITDQNGKVLTTNRYVYYK